jgi:DNA-directed RNA polymerase specialized sigma24 family protein
VEISIKDDLLLDRWLRRNAASMGEIQAEYGKPFYGFLVAAYGGREKEAEALFLTSFTAVLRASALENRKVSFLIQLLHHAVQALRASKAPLPPASMQILSRLSADEDIQVRLLLGLKILDTLALEERLMILLRDLAELSMTEMAYVLGADEDTLKTRLTEARIRFREKMNESLRSKSFYDLRKN